MSKKIVFSGLVYGQRPTGIYRYANEILMELDKIVEKDKYELIVPVYAKNLPNLSNIKIVYYGKIKGLLWEQTSFVRYIKKNKALSINFTNSGPLIHKGVIVIHDISYKLNPSFYKSLHGQLARIWHRFNYLSYSKHKKSFIITDTNYSKETIVKYYKVKEERIFVIGCGWEHISRIKEDCDSLKKYNLLSKTYFFTLGSLSARKNTDWIFKAAKKFPNETFVVAGGIAKNSSKLNDFPENVNLIGYITDEEMVNLMKNCKAFIFPSLFEGFGIPPLEAMALGAPCIVSNSSCLPEIYGDSVYYINPTSVPDNLDIIHNEDKCFEVLSKYSWKKSAELMKEFLTMVETERR